jgi:hypothetical protein
MAAGNDVMKRSDIIRHNPGWRSLPAAESSTTATVSKPGTPRFSFAAAFIVGAGVSLFWRSRRRSQQHVADARRCWRSGWYHPRSSELS